MQMGTVLVGHDQKAFKRLGAAYEDRWRRYVVPVGLRSLALILPDEPGPLGALIIMRCQWSPARTVKSPSAGGAKNNRYSRRS